MSPTTATSTSTEHPPTQDRAAFLEAVLDAMPEGLLVADEERIIDVNSAICELTGFARADLVGAQMPFPFFPPEESDRILGFMRKIRGPRSGGAELTLMRKDGSRFAALVSGADAQIGEQRLGRVITVRDVSEQRRRELRLAELAAKDELTGLHNKRSFLVNLAGEVARARRNQRPLSLAILDLDDFKRINDEGGHQAGDRVLAEAAGRLGALVRTGELMARVGGDEFGWILPDADTEGAASAVSRARTAISGEAFRGMGALGLSSGICVTDGSIDAGELYRRADRALYKAKTAGRNGIEFF